MMLEQLITRSDTDSALRALGPYQLIDETRLAEDSYVIEAMPAMLNTQPFIRLRVVRTSKRKRDCFSRSIAWPVADAEKPVELAAIARKILDATLGIRPRRDPRGLRLRLRDQFNRRQLVNHIEDLAVTRVDGMGKIRLSVTIFEDALDEETATIYQTRHHSRLITITLPVTSVQRVLTWAKGEAR
ncbi:hypothetical protein NCG89_14790 [Spongiibacter taiwanensis]|uniref:hypothetical protein n=1 Tax=Spongiibacter taiwanensis TaxID=1748242 RepID=UPI002035481E|nr:hypothetical protein [Spongiibacter taiwanensis]USA42798.1 hypothetical protein NCG89_14790 [Spongiibacter taiwanensis]